MRFFKAHIETSCEGFLRGTHSEIPFNNDNSQTFALLQEYKPNYFDNDTIMASAYLISNNIHLSAENAESLFIKACETWGAASLTNIEVSETSFKEIDESRWGGEKFNFDNIISMLDLFEFKTLLMHEEILFENTSYRPLSKTHALNKAHATTYSQTLSAEISRIFAQALTPQTSNGPISLPVHYVIQGDIPAHYKPALESLIGALHESGRIATQHVYRLNLDRFTNYVSSGEYRHVGPSRIESLNNKFAEAIKGSTVIVEYGRFDKNDTYNMTAYKALLKFIGTMKNYYSSTQLIFLIPSKNDKLEQRLARRLDIPLVLLHENAKLSAQSLSRAKALSYLTKKAQNEGIVPDKTLNTMLNEYMKDKSFQDLDLLFNDWRLEKLLQTNYPLYRDAVQTMHLLRKHPQTAVSAAEELEQLIGLTEIKAHIKNIILRFRMNKKLEQAGLPPQPFSMHLAFLGEPGTGKTEVARLYGNILREEGLLSEGRIITVSGAGGWDVKETFEAARGSVLFIDEAYGMTIGLNKVEQLIALMEERRHNTVVILAGYENEMNRLFDSNPGFRSRLGFTLNFPNYSLDEQVKIFQLMAQRAQLKLPQKTVQSITDMLARGGKRDDQGNARFVRKLFEDCVGAQQVRLAQNEPKDGYTLKMMQTILPEDVGYKTPRKRTKCARQQLEELIGLHEVKNIVNDRLNYALVNKMRRDAGLSAAHLPMHMAFKGNPGTGKTEVARLIGKVLKEEGILSVGDFFECGRQDLVGPFVGTTAPKIEALFRRAKGSVIFIDEAYSLNDQQRGGFGDEAITTIIDQMEKLRDDVVVIFAGYTQEIDELFKQNPGFVSRIGKQIVFPDYSIDELTKIFKFMTKQQGLYLAKNVSKKVRAILELAIHDKNFGNARYVRNMLENALVAQSTRLATEYGTKIPSNTELLTLNPEDFQSNGCVQVTRAPIGFAP